MQSGIFCHVQYCACWKTHKIEHGAMLKCVKNCTMCRVGAMQHYVTRSGDGSPRSQYCNIVTHNQSNPQPIQHPQFPHFCFQMESVSRWPVWPVWVKVSPTDQNCPIRGFPNQKLGLAWLAILQNHQGERSATAILVLVCSSGTPLDVICRQSYLSAPRKQKET